MKKHTFIPVIAYGIAFGLMILNTAMADMKFKSNGKGGLVGNGGGTVVCRDPKDNHILSVELLDFYEARTLHQRNIDLKDIPGDWHQKIQGALDRIATLSDFHAQLYRLWNTTFEKESTFLKDVQFSTVPDSGYIGVPQGCQFEQAAIQRTPMFSGESRYYINAGLWNAMDDIQKAGLVLHELIYREALAYGHTDSIRSRYLNGMYASDSFKTLNLESYLVLLQQAHFEETDMPLPAQTLISIKDLKSIVKLDRFWHAGPDDKNIPMLSLHDRVLGYTGVCLNEGCKDFDSKWYDRTLSNPQEYKAPLGSDLVSIEFGNYLFSFHLPVGNKKVLGLFAYPGTFYFGGSAPVFDLALKNNPEIVLQNIQNIDVFEKNGDFHFQDIGLQKFKSKNHQYFDMTGFCEDPTTMMDFENDVPISFFVWPVSDDCEKFMTIRNNLDNGSADLASYPRAESIFLDSKMNFIASDNYLYSRWNGGEAVTCSLNYKEGCLQVVILNGLATKLKVVNQSPDYRVRLNKNDFKAQIAVGSTIELFAKGSVHSFVIAKDTMIIWKGVQTNIPAGSRVEVDEGGVLSQIH